MMILSRIALAVILTLGVRTAFAADGMSIDCATSTEPFAKRICGNRLASELDRQVTALYKKLTNTLSGAALTEVKNSQRQWWKGRNSCEGPCVLVDFANQIGVLRSYESYSILIGPPFADNIYDEHFASIDKAILAHSSGVDLILYVNRDDRLPVAEYDIRNALLAYDKGKSSEIVAAITQETTKDNFTHLNPSQHARIAILYAAATSRMAQDPSPFIEKYCVDIGSSCNRAILQNRDALMREVIRLGQPVTRQREELASRYAQEALNALMVRADQIAKEEAAAREAEARRQQEERDRQARLAAEAERQRQAELDRQAQLEAEARAQEKAREEAAAAAERQAAEEEARRLHRTFRYQATVLGGALVDSIKLVLALTPVWIYPIAALLGWLMHRHLALRLTLGLASFAVLAYLSALASPFGPVMPRGAAALLTYVWQAWAGYDLDSPDGLGARIALTYVPLLIAAYLLAWILVGPETRASEIHRWGRFMPRWMNAGRYALAERWAEGTARRRQLRAAKFEAKLAAVQMQAQSAAAGAPPYPYAYPPPRGGVIRGFFDFSRGVLSLVKWAIVAGLAYAFVKYGDSILDKGLLLIDKASGLANNVMPLFR